MDQIRGPESGSKLHRGLVLLLVGRSSEFAREKFGNNMKGAEST